MKREWIAGVCAVLVCVFFVVTPSRAETPEGLPSWLEGVKTEALNMGIRQETLDAALGDVQPIDRVIELDRKQPEFQLTFAEYLARAVTQQRVDRGRAALAEETDLLVSVSGRYGVPPEVIVAMWGIESNYGKLTGGFTVIPALATLAYDGRRSRYFRSELMNALVMIDTGKTSPGEMTGSWAGAMGQCQFMPSTYLKYAVAWDGNGRPDIWSNHADVFSSTANYLSSLGWKANEGWGTPVTLPEHGIAPVLMGLDTKMSVGQWGKLGIRRADGGELPDSPVEASLIRAESGKGDDVGVGTPYLVYDNFRTLMRWNRSVFFALAAGTLADRIANQ